mmetsp:Transcript_49057/g.116800  ORF Transcript_49057/g.116800 Transcript_49057/m.116800 type:complete len:227 (+) Transcript_49057:793-1473(+)
MLTWQSTGTPPPQLGSSLHGEVCFSAPSHHRPFSLPCTAMTRARLLMPAQGVVQPLQGCHWPKTQSTFGPQETWALQEACSIDMPIGGLPHSLAWRRSFRERHVMPPSQLLVQASQEVHSLHNASMQSPVAQGCVLQGSISSLSMALHAAPPGEGITAIVLSRVRCPPSHSQVQPLQDDQSDHRQSLGPGQSPRPGTPPYSSLTHSRCSARVFRQPDPPSDGICVI